MHSKRYIKKYVFGLALMLSLFTGSELKAQIDLQEALKTWGYNELEIEARSESFDLQVDSNLYRAPQMGNKYYDLVLPDTVAYPYLYVQVRGSDGAYNRQEYSGEYTAGGEGATIWTNFKIGAGSGEIQPGGTLRFIIGETGVHNSRGGAGTGLAYKDPETGQWSMLVVAGGGGGSGGYEIVGVPGQITEDGSPGRGYGGNGGSDGEDGRDNTGKYSRAGEPGKGYKSSMKEVDTDDNEEIDEHDEPVGSTGSATWGFGGGGDVNDDGGLNVGAGGGGGGGYSGGGGGKLTGSRGGGGGGSYVNPDFIGVNTVKMANHSTLDPQDGFVEFQFTDDPKVVWKEIPSAAATDQCLDLYKGITDNETNIQLYECTGHDPQQWLIDGPYIRLAKNTDKCVEVNSSKTAVYLYDCDYGTSQQWIYDGLSSTFRSAIYPKDACLGLMNGSTANDTDVRAVPCTGSNTQQWQIEGATSAATSSGVKTIHLASNTDKCLDLYQGTIANTTNIQLYQCTGHDPQQWVFDEDNLRIQINKDQDWCVDLKGGHTDNGTNIELYECHERDNQQWLYDGLTQSFRTAVDPSKCLQVEGTTFVNDSNVELSDCDGSDAQRWVIED